MKLSKYNYCTYNKDNELLLFNSMQGTVSMLKVPQEYASCVHAALTKQVDLDSIDHNIYKELVDNKYIIEDTIDESAQLRKIYLDQIGDSQLQLTILPTEQCNFRCKYCYESFPDNTMNQEVKDSIIMYLKKNLHHFSSLHISWFGGEPLLELERI